jgi:hypothetical protein
LAYADGHVVGTRSFQILSTQPSIAGVHVADVLIETGAGTDGQIFDAGVKVVYLSYDYVGLCSGTRVAHRLYHQGELQQDNVVVWSGDSKGRAQIGLQAPNNSAFPSGDYEIVVAIAGKEQGRTSFSVEVEERELEPVLGPPAFGDITVALGVRPDGTPILTAEGRTFGWSTRAVHAVFEYQGMSDGVSWSVVWTRNSTEIAREEYVWNAKTAGNAGVYWVTLSNPEGEPLGGGNYTVTLYVRDELQSETDFRLYYPPAEED